MMKYEEMIQDLEQKVRRMESGDMDIDSLCDEVAKAKEMIDKCNKKLSQVDKSIKELYETN